MCSCPFSILNLLELPLFIYPLFISHQKWQDWYRSFQSHLITEACPEVLNDGYFSHTDFSQSTKLSQNLQPIPSPDIWLLMSHVWICVFLEQAREMDLQYQCSLLRLGRPIKHIGPEYLSLLGFCECGSPGKWESSRLPTVSAIAFLLVLNHFSNLSVSLRSDGLWHHIRITWWTRNGSTFRKPQHTPFERGIVKNTSTHLKVYLLILPAQSGSPVRQTISPLLIDLLCQLCSKRNVLGK